MQVFVVSGFLGAGKTTFIQELARRCGRDFVVYENEYGQADLDAKTLGASDGLSVWESTENCICCSGKQDFAASVLTIANTLDPDYLVVEPTGVARLSSVLNNVSQVAYERISLLSPVVVVDALNWRRELERARDIFMDQVQSAPTIVISKVAMAPLGEVGELSAWLATAAPHATIVAESWESLDPEWFLQLLTPRPINPSASDSIGAQVATASAIPATSATPTAAAAPAAEEPDYERLSLRQVNLPSESHLLWFLDALVAGTFGDIARAKGVLVCGGQPLRFDVVDRIWQVTGAEELHDGSPEESVAVFIGEGIRKSWLREVLVPAIREAAEKGDAQATYSEAYDVEHEHHEHYGHGHDAHHHG